MAQHTGKAQKRIEIPLKRGESAQLGAIGHIIHNTASHVAALAKK